jgi:hypothetical protein
MTLPKCFSALHLAVSYRDADMEDLGAAHQECADDATAMQEDDDMQQHP